MSRARRDPSFSAPFDRLVNRDRIDGMSEARAGIRLKNGARTGRQATQIERLNSMDTGEVSLEFSRERGNTEGWGGILQSLFRVDSQLSPALGVLYTMYCRVMATAQMLLIVSSTSVLWRDNQLTIDR